MAKKQTKPRTTKANPLKPPKATGGGGGEPKAPDASPDMDSEEEKILAIAKAIIEKEKEDEAGRVLKSGNWKARSIRAIDIEATLAAARDSLSMLLWTARALDVDPAMQAKAGSALVDALRFFVSAWQAGSTKATLQPIFPMLRDENQGFRLRLREIYPRASRHDKLSQAVNTFVFVLLWDLSHRGDTSTELAVFGTAIPTISNKGESLPQKRFKAFDQWAAKVKAFDGLNSYWDVHTRVRHAQAVHFESYWTMVFMPIAKKLHNDAVNNPAKVDERWREIANHPWRGTVEKRAKKSLYDRLMVFGGTKISGSFIW